MQLFDIIVSDQDSSDVQGLVLEHIDGEDLQLNSFSCDDRFLSVLWQIACGLRDIHAAGIIHRDIKPNNIRMTRDGVVKILDFGLARPDGASARTLSVIGTPGYMAPELWQAGTISFNNAIDVYAFGVAVLALLGVDPPPAILARPPVPVDPTRLTPLISGLPPDISMMVARCISFQPVDRPPMVEVVQTIAKHLLRDKHRALVVYNRRPLQIDKNNRTVTMNVPTIGSITIDYNGHSFVASASTGIVYLNNTPVVAGMTVPNCCVITFGRPGTPRQFVTFDVSNPEVMP